MSNRKRKRVPGRPSKYPPEDAAATFPGRALCQ
jgi:hypothetical protein